MTDATIVQLGLLKGYTHALAKAGGQFVVFDAVTADAPIPVVEKAIAFYQRRGCDAIVAFGGGSPMDAAKVVAYAVANRKPPRKLVGYFKGLSAPVPLYAVPTTAGTGSEDDDVIVAHALTLSAEARHGYGTVTSVRV